MENADDLVPLHSALEKNAPLAIIKLLASPKVVRIKDGNEKSASLLRNGQRSIHRLESTSSIGGSASAISVGPRRVSG